MHNAKEEKNEPRHVFVAVDGFAHSVSRSLLYKLKQSTRVLQTVGKNEFSIP